VASLLAAPFSVVPDATVARFARIVVGIGVGLTEVHEKPW
jgi:hypothetical protein